ncbi:MAG: PAS domain S-box protein [Limisphaerales bacterium]
MTGKKNSGSRIKLAAARKPGSYVQNLQKTHEDLALQNQLLQQTQFELEVSRDHYAEFFDTAPVCFATLTVSGIIREINLPGIRLLSRRHERLTGWPFVTFIAEPDRKIFMSHLSRCRKNVDPTRPISVELQLARHAKHDAVFIELVSIPHIEKDSRRLVLKNVFRDITEFKQVLGVHRWLAAIVESSDDAIIGRDLYGKIISCNQSACHLYGYSREEMVGKPIAILSPPDLEDEQKKIAERLRQGGKLEHYETVRRRKDGTLIPVSLTISPIRDASGKVIGASAIARDITERKNYEQRLEESLARTMAANRAKDDFLAALSHELRTPLNPVLLLASDGVRNMDFTPQARVNFDTIRKNIELEARLIDDMLDLTRITRGKLTLDMKPVDIHSALRDAAAIVQADIENKSIELMLNLAASKPVVRGDAVRLRQIFWNVLKNAVKFTPQGGKVSIETRELEGNKLVVAISDTGIGMEPGELERVFGAFAQGTHHFGGLGLGLAISRALVQLHAGSIRAESGGKDKGAKFSIELPVATGLEAYASASSGAVSAPPAPVKRIPTRDIRILLVEDHEPTRSSLTHLLSRRNYKVTPVGSLAEARSILGKIKFHLLISDIGLPDGNGCDLMEELRQESNLKGIALTGYGMEHDVNRSYAAGFTAHLTKPVRMESLDDALSMALTDA